MVSYVWWLIEQNESQDVYYVCKGWEGDESEVMHVEKLMINYDSSRNEVTENTENMMFNNRNEELINTERRKIMSVYDCRKIKVLNGKILLCT